MLIRFIFIIFFISTIVGEVWASEKKTWNEDNYEGWVWRKSLNFKLPNNSPHFIDADAIHQELSDRTHRLVENLREKSRNVVLLRLGLVLEDENGNQGYAVLPCFDDYIFSSGMDRDKGKETFISEYNLTQGVVMTNESKTTFILHSYIMDEPRNYSFALENRLSTFKSRFESQSGISSLKLEKYKEQDSRVQKCLMPPNKGLVKEDIISVAENALNTIKREYEDRIDRYTDSEQKFFYFMEESLSPVPFFWDLCLPSLIDQLIRNIEDYYAFLQYESLPEYLEYQENVLISQMDEKLAHLEQEINDQNQNDLKKLCNELKEVRRKRKLSPEELEKNQQETQIQRLKEIKQDLIRGSKDYDTSHKQYSKDINSVSLSLLKIIGEFKETLNKPQITSKERSIKSTKKGNIDSFFLEIQGYEPSDTIALGILKKLKEIKEIFDKDVEFSVTEIMKNESSDKLQQKENLEQNISTIKNKLDERILKIHQHKASSGYETSPDIQAIENFSETLGSLLKRTVPEKYSELKALQKNIEEKILAKKELSYKKWMNILFSYLERTDKKILGMVLHLHSRNDVCHFCGPSITRECERTNGFASKLTNMCEILNKNRYQDTVPPFFRVLFSCNEIRNKNTGLDRFLYRDNCFDNLIQISPTSSRFGNSILLDNINQSQGDVHEVLYPLKPIVFFQCHIPHTGLF